MVAFSAWKLRRPLIDPDLALVPFQRKPGNLSCPG
jgi:hypothetical protein